jgi:hypothetical protein
MRRSTKLRDYILRIEYICGRVPDILPIIPDVQRLTLSQQLYQSQSQSQSHITTDGQSSVRLGVEPNLGLLIRDFFFKVSVLTFGGALSDKRSGLSCVSLCH